MYRFWDLFSPRVALHPKTLAWDALLIPASLTGGMVFHYLVDERSSGFREFADVLYSSCRAGYWLGAVFDLPSLRS